MIKIKRLLVSFAALILVLGITISAAAAQSVSYWYSDADNVRYNPYDGSYYIYNFSSNDEFTSYFRDGVSSARSQWDSILPISISETSIYYALNSVYGGTTSQLQSSFPELSSALTGLTYAIPNGEPTYVTYGGNTKSVYKLQAGNRMCVVQRNDRTAKGYKNTAVHEMGHLWGWRGHSLNANDVMYATASEIVTLTSRDKNHLTQIYDMFY